MGHDEREGQELLQCLFSQQISPSSTGRDHVTGARAHCTKVLIDEFDFIVQTRALVDPEVVDVGLEVDVVSTEAETTKERGHEDKDLPWVEAAEDTEFVEPAFDELVELGCSLEERAPESGEGGQEGGHVDGRWR